MAITITQYRHQHQQQFETTIHIQIFNNTPQQRSGNQNSALGIL